MLCAALIGAMLRERHSRWRISALFLKQKLPGFLLRTGNESLLQQLKNLTKASLYGLGPLPFYHRIRNKRHLTVAMFHRVLPSQDARRKGADPEWTMTSDNFDACLKFFKQHYNPISMTELAAAIREKRSLPARSLLITFDDGWADTAEIAQPILNENQLSAVVFVVGSAVNQVEPLWQESIYQLLAAHPDGAEQLRSALAQCGIEIRLDRPSYGDEASIRAVVQQLDRQEPARLSLLASILQRQFGTPPAMITSEQLNSLIHSHHHVGSHGMTHQLLTRVESVESEVTLAKEALSRHLNGFPIDSMSFPHGALNDHAIAACRAARYKYLFSSEAILNDADALSPDELVFGRIPISERNITDSHGKFSPFMLAYWLFLRPLGRPGGSKNAN